MDPGFRENNGESVRINRQMRMRISLEKVSESERLAIGIELIPKSSGFKDLRMCIVSLPGARVPL